MINAAEKPVFYVGQGAVISGAHDVLAKCAREANIPVTTTLQGLGAFNERDPLSLHMLGMHGSAYANWAMRDADCIIAVGARFDDRVTGKPRKFAPGPAPPSGKAAAASSTSTSHPRTSTRPCR